MSVPTLKRTDAFIYYTLPLSGCKRGGLALPHFLKPYTIFWGWVVKGWVMVFLDQFVFLCEFMSLQDVVTLDSLERVA